MRHNIVMFGEAAPHYADLYAALQECDLFVCIGTSGEVLDVANFARYFKFSILNNLDASRIDKYFDKCYLESAVTAAPKWENDIREFLSDWFAKSLINAYGWIYSDKFIYTKFIATIYWRLNLIAKFI